MAPKHSAQSGRNASCGHGRRMVRSPDPPKTSDLQQYNIIEIIEHLWGILEAMMNSMVHSVMFFERAERGDCPPPWKCRS